MERIGPWELILVLLVVLVIFGGAKLPEAGRNLGQAIREFRKASRSEDEPRDSKALAAAEQPAAAKEQVRG